MRQTNFNNSQLILSPTFTSCRMAAQTPRILQTENGKTQLRCPQNYIYTKNNGRGNTEYWKCIEFRRKHCSAILKLDTTTNVILNQPEHLHVSRSTRRDSSFDIERMSNHWKAAAGGSAPRRRRPG